MAEVFKDNNFYIVEFLRTVRDGLEKSQKAKGLRASGASIASVRVVTPSDNVGQIIDPLDVFKYQDTPGRAKTTGGGDGSLKRIIYDWLLYKKYGFNWTTDKQRKTMAYFITRKIHAKGTYIHITKKITNLLPDAINKQKLSELSQILAKKYGTIIGSVIARSLLDQKNSSESLRLTNIR